MYVQVLLRRTIGGQLDACREHHYYKISLTIVQKMHENVKECIKAYFVTVYLLIHPLAVRVRRSLQRLKAEASLSFKRFMLNLIGSQHQLSSPSLYACLQFFLSPFKYALSFWGNIIKTLHKQVVNIITSVYLKLLR